MSYKIIVQPQAELLSAQDLHSHLGLGPDETDWDGLIDDFIAAARALAENYIRQLLLTQTVQAVFDGFGQGRLQMPIGPVQSIEKVEYRRDGGDWEDLSPTQYRAYLAKQPGYLLPASGFTWPLVTFEPETVRVTYVAGFGADKSSVAPDIVHAIRLLVTDSFTHRGDEASKAAQREMHPGAEARLSSHREWF